MNVLLNVNSFHSLMYRTLRQNLSLADLIQRAQTLGGDDQAVKRLMNMIMQFRKVCNHPELFERADVSGPLSLCSFAASYGAINREGDLLDLPYSTRSRIHMELPKLVYRESLAGELAERPLQPIGGDTLNLERLFNIWSSQHVASSKGPAPFTLYSDCAVLSVIFT